MELRDYNYLPSKPVHERRLAIEYALMENDLDTVMKQLKTIEHYHPNITIDIQELDEYIEDILFLKNVLIVEKSYENKEKTKKKIVIDYGNCVGRKRISFGSNKEYFRKINKKIT